MVKNLRLGEILKQAGIIDDFQLNSALSYQRHWGGRFGEALIKLGYLTEYKLQNFLAQQFDLPQIKLSEHQITDDVLAYIPVEKAHEFHVLPVERTEIRGTMHLVVAMTDPTNLMMIDSLQFMTGCRIKAALASDEAIGAAIERSYGAEIDGQVKLDLAREDLVELSPSAPLQMPVAVDDIFTATTLKQLENRYENLVRILLDRGVLNHKDLNELT